MSAVLDGNRLTLSGNVGDIWGGDCFTYGDVLLTLAQVPSGSTLTVHMNSGGGVATEGAAIHALFAGRDGTTNFVVEGIAASAASLIVMAGDTVTMAAGSVLMIHDPASLTFGTVEDHNRTVEGLEALATAYARVYAAKSGKSAAECRTIMKAERWYEPEEAVAEGFADAAGTGKAEPVAAFAYGAYAHAPKKLVALAKRRNWSLPEARTEPTPRATLSTQPRKEPLMPAPNQPNADAIAQARRDATARLKTITTSAQARDMPSLAAHLAYDTDLDPDVAEGIMAAAAKDAKAPRSGNAPASDRTMTGATAFQQRVMNAEGLNGGGDGPSGHDRQPSGLVARMKIRHGVE